MSKQVKGAAPVAQATTPVATNGNSRNLYMSVNTFDSEGKTIGERIVDLYHFGTRGWLQNHFWWAMHNGHTVEVNVANDDEIQAYTAAGVKAFAEKFNTAPAEPEAAVA